MLTGKISTRIPVWGGLATMPRIIGITGNIASGKTSVGQHLLELGVKRYIDADALVHRLYEGGQPIAASVAEAFGAEVMASDGSVDRKELGKLVFEQREAMQRLERIVHPAVGAALLKELSTLQTSDIVVIDAVKLLEGGSGTLAQSKWLVVCTEEQQMERLKRRNGLSDAEAQARIQAQPELAPKYALVDEVIDNSGSLAETRGQVEAAFQRFLKKFCI
jgi:dephospho-CoA kinase